MSPGEIKIPCMEVILRLSST